MRVQQVIDTLSGIDPGSEKSDYNFVDERGNSITGFWFDHDKKTVVAVIPATRKEITDV